MRSTHTLSFFKIISFFFLPFLLCCSGVALVCCRLPFSLFYCGASAWLLFFFSWGGPKYKYPMPSFFLFLFDFFFRLQSEVSTLCFAGLSPLLLLSSAAVLLLLPFLCVYFQAQHTSFASRFCSFFHSLTYLRIFLLFSLSLCFAISRS